MDDRIEKSLFFIEQHITEPFSLDDLAKAACLSPHHFHRLFKSETGETPKNYLDRVRMEHIAHMMVVRKDMSITDIAFDYHYSSPAAFTRAFKAIYQTTPRAFRDKVREQHKERLQKHWASLEDGENFEPQKIALHYMPIKRLEVIRTLLQEELLNDAYRQLIKQNNQTDQRTSHGVTIYTEGPFTDNRDNIRIHIGLDKPPTEASNNKILEIGAGYYHQRHVTGDFDAMTDAMYKSFQRDIEPSSYKVASTTFYERVPLPENPNEFDYFSSKRVIFGCLTRR